jgi:lipopolysaccharide/colanic/teichoic acid biosynthesis glycosyltransferase
MYDGHRPNPRRDQAGRVPQLWSVLRDDMSLVGPRPGSLSFFDCFRDGFEKLLDYKPGVFGPCQVLFRHENRMYPADTPAAEYYRKALFPAKAKVDLAYFPHRTLGSDFGWIARVPPSSPATVIRCEAVS